MADHHKQSLHELLKENQEPFLLKNYIAERRSQLKNPAQKTCLQIKKQKSIEPAPRSLCRHACFLSFQSSPEWRRSPFRSPLKSPGKSPRGGGAVFLHVPSRTAAMLLEAAMRIQSKQQQSKISKPGFGLIGSLLKRLKDRSKNKNQAIGNNVTQLPTNLRRELEVEIVENERISCSCDNRAAELEASTSSCRYRRFEEMVDNFITGDLRFCESPFRFSLRRSPSYSGSTAVRTPEFCSPATSPRLSVTQEKEICETKSPKNRNGEDDDDEKEHCSPVSILDPPFEDEDGHESEEDEAEDDQYDPDESSSYTNVLRAKQQLLHRLRRFERLAGLDPVELERKLLESSDDDFDQETAAEPNQEDDTFLRLMNLKSMEENGETASGRDEEVVFGRILNRSGSWKKLDFDTIDRMIDLDFKMDSDGWKEVIEEIAAEFELELFGIFIEEIWGELFC